jgi:hypothetical protein
MLETITLITLTLLFLSFVRPGKTPPLDNPLVIDRPGRYHMTLAPRLNLAQPFIEAIAAQMELAGGANSATQYFEVRDKQARAHGHDHYLLAVTCRNGVLYFQAVCPEPGKQDWHILDEFSQPVLARFPAQQEPDPALTGQIATAATHAAEPRGIHLKQLLQ